MFDFSQLEIIYEDNHLIAANKPAGILVHSDKTGDVPLSEYVKKYIKIRYNKPGDVFLGVIHRLDRPVSGVVVFARTSKALTRMNTLLRNREIEKKYLAITKERPDTESGHLTHYLIKDREKNKVKAFEKPSRRNKDAKKAELKYRLIAASEGLNMLQIELLTGRPHQIRVQLAAIGCPIVGDLKYGYRKPNRDASINLHCKAMRFVHPVKKEEIQITAQLPEEEMHWRPFWEI